MKNILKILIIIFVISSCKEEIQSNCICKSATINTIPNEELNIPIEKQKMGVIFFKDDDIPDIYVPEEKFNNRFWIFQGSKGCYNCQRKFVICNDNLLGKEFDFLKQENNSDSIKVEFTGDLKLFCSDKLIAAPGDFYYAGIVLKSIKIIN